MNKKLLLLLILFNLISPICAAQVPSYVPTSNLVGWWPFSGNADDISGTGNNATNFNATLSTDRFNNPNAAYSFNGTNAYLTVPTPTFTLSATGSFSFSVWMKKQASTGVSLMVGSSAANNFITLLGGETSTSFGANKQSLSWIWCTAPHTLNNWDHYVGVYDAGQMTLYKNGAAVTTAQYTHTNTNSANLPLFLGKDINTSYFNGQLDDIGFWTRAITPAEVLALYNQTALAINDNEIKELMIYPNPTSDQVTINIGNLANEGEVTARIVNTLGQEIYKTQMNQEQLTIPLKSIASSGLYFVTIYDALSDTATTKKVIVR